MARRAMPKSPRMVCDSTYSTSDSASPEYAILARLRIHHRQTKPGLALYRLRAWRSRGVNSPGETARGPTKDMSPLRMLNRAGIARKRRGDLENESSSKDSHQRPARLV